MCATHRNEDRDVTPRGYRSKNIADLFLSLARRIPGCLEVVEQDKAAMFRGIEFGDDFFKLISISRYLKLGTQDLEEESCRRGLNARHPNTVSTWKPLLDERGFDDGK